MGTGDGERFHTTVEIEFAIGSIGPLMAQPPDAPTTRRTRAHHIDHHPTGELASQVPQLLIGRSTERGEQRQGSIGILTHQLIEGHLVEFANLG